jgi:pyruvate dehydrogenase E1 component alpha subunit
MERKTNREELLGFFREMTLMRRMEIAADVAYKQKLIRGFLHLYNGQEAVASGIESQMTKNDHVVTAYRCHAHLVTRRCATPVKGIIAELYGKKTGCSKGYGGSMHMYNAETNFYGGNGIVGAQIPLGTGVAWSQKYLKTGNVTFAYMGDGAANQGQTNESYNLAAVHKLPIVFVVENNRYAMGTAIERASATKEFYSRGDYIPGLQFDGMNVLQSAEASKFAIDYAKTKGPILLEGITYRYQGHSMSDPGTTYRNRDEVEGVRKSRDPIVKVHQWLIENKLATEEELTAITEEVKKEVEAAVEFATTSPVPSPEDLYKFVYIEDMPLRGVELQKSHNLKI